MRNIGNEPNPFPIPCQFSFQLTRVAGSNNPENNIKIGHSIDQCRCVLNVPSPKIAGKNDVDFRVIELKCRLGISIRQHGLKVGNPHETKPSSFCRPISARRPSRAVLPPRATGCCS